MFTPLDPSAGKGPAVSSGICSTSTPLLVEPLALGEPDELGEPDRLLGMAVDPVAPAASVSTAEQPTAVDAPAPITSVSSPRRPISRGRS